MDKIKRLLSAETAGKIFESRIFVLIWALIVLICWATGGWIAGFIIAAVLACAILCLCRDTLPALSILWTFLFMLGVNRHNLQGSAPLISAVIFVVIGFIVNIIRFKPSFKFVGYKTVGAPTVGILVFCAGVAVSGIAMSDRNLGAAFIVVALAVLLAFGYLFFSATVSGGEDGKRVIRYLMFVMFVSGLLISVQLLIRYGKMGNGSMRQAFISKNMDLGWGGPNNYSIVLAMMIPSTIWYALKHGKLSPIFILLAVFQFALVFLSRSRGSILFGAMMLIAAIGYLLVKTEYRGRAMITVLLVIEVGLFLAMYNSRQLLETLMPMLNMGLDDNGREELYSAAVNLFKRQPIFGVGFDYRLGGMAGDGYSPYWYHSTFFQALASTGIVGFAAWIYLEWTRLRAFLTDLCPEKFLLLTAFAIFWLYALTDVFYFTPNGLIFLFVITLAIDKSVLRPKGRPYFLVYTERKRMARMLTKNEDE